MARQDTGALAAPEHIAIIMDGNGRWAKQRGLPRTAGHSAGAEAFRRIADHCNKLGVRYLTVYAFSTENWKRSTEEVEGIMKLLGSYLQEFMRDMEKNRFRICFYGDLSRINPKLRAMCEESQTRSRDYDVQINICLNYGGRAEIVDAVNRLIASGVGAVTEEMLSDAVYTAGQSDPDLIVRTAGELRLSNFLAWQSVYSEFYFTDTLWPDMKEEDIDKAVDAYYGRTRRFGAV